MFYLEGRARSFDVYQYLVIFIGAIYGRFPNDTVSEIRQYANMFVKMLKLICK